MDPHGPEDDPAGRRQRLAHGVVIAMTVGVALSLALEDWGMLVVGIGLSIVLWAGSGAR